MATATTAEPQDFTSTTGMNNDNQAVEQPPAEEQYITTFFCRALYDYQTKDPSSLSFHRNDIIEVLTQLESGWWDGLLGDERGWFPSNYVAVISDEEADSALSGSDFSLQHAPISHESLVDMSLAMHQESALSDSDREWIDGEKDRTGARKGLREVASAASKGGIQSSDFWMPEVTVDGQVLAWRNGSCFDILILFTDILRQYTNWPTLARLASRT